mmetsp:Transcript_29091/g.84124  ORF Transcript_29091/g.84124 Transcript_29091/m.84124 type:complete len:217 (-) Transcript_29091:609-1259(-)
MHTENDTTHENDRKGATETTGTHARRARIQDGNIAGRCKNHAIIQSSFIQKLINPRYCGKGVQRVIAEGSFSDRSGVMCQSKPGVPSLYLTPMQYPPHLLLGHFLLFARNLSQYTFVPWYVNGIASGRLNMLNSQNLFQPLSSCKNFTSLSYCLIASPTCWYANQGMVVTISPWLTMRSWCRFFRPLQASLNFELPTRGAANETTIISRSGMSIAR